MAIKNIEWDSILIEPLIYDKKKKEYLQYIKKNYPDDVLILNEKKGNKIEFQWIKLKANTLGLAILLDLINEFDFFVSIHAMKYKLIEELPSNLLKLIEKKIDIEELKKRIGEFGNE